MTKLVNNDIDNNNKLNYNNANDNNKMVKK